MLLRARYQERLKASGKAASPGLPAPPEVRDLLVAGGRKSRSDRSRRGAPGPHTGSRRKRRRLSRSSSPAIRNGPSACWPWRRSWPDKRPGRRCLESPGRTPGRPAPTNRWPRPLCHFTDAPSVTEDQRKQVEAWLAEASQKQPDLVSLANKLGAIWIRQGKFDEAEAKYRQILGSNPDELRGQEQPRLVAGPS